MFILAFVYLVLCEWRNFLLSLRPCMHLTGCYTDNVWNINTTFRPYNSHRKSFVNFFITNPCGRIIFICFPQSTSTFFVEDEKRCINPARWSRISQYKRVGTPQFRYLTRKCAPLWTPRPSISPGALESASFFVLGYLLGIFPVWQVLPYAAVCLLCEVNKVPLGQVSPWMLSSSLPELRTESRCCCHALPQFPRLAYWLGLDPNINLISV